MWTYLGEISSTLAHPTAISFDVSNAVVGWIVPCEFTTSRVHTWALEFPELNATPRANVTIICSGQDSRFFMTCHRAQLRCWALGNLLIINRIHCVFLQRVSIWHISENPPTSIPKQIAITICSNAAAEIFYMLWRGSHTMLAMQNEFKPLMFQPIIYSRLQAIISAIDKVVPMRNQMDTRRAAGFVVHQEEGASHGITRLCYSNGVPLGKSDLVYVPSTGSVVHRRHSSVHKNFSAASATIVISSSSDTLLSTMTALCASDLPDSTTLIIAPRHIFPVAHVVLTKALKHYIAFATLRDVTELNIALPQVVLASLELVQSHNPFERVHSRLILLGWPHTADVLRRSNVRVKSTFTLALALEAEADAAMIPNSHSTTPLYRERLSDLFGISAEKLLNVRLIDELISSRVMRLSESTEEFVSLSHEVLLAPGLSNAEEIRFANLKDPYLGRNVILGYIHGSEGPFPWLPKGGNTAIHAYFCKKSPMKAAQIDNFALKSYDTRDERDNCPICFEPIPTTVTLCGHWFCGDCLLPALETVPACPICKCPTDSRNDAVSVGKPVPSIETLAFVNFITDTLKNAPEKSIVLCSHGELHEKLVSTLREKGINIVAWTGNARQVNLRYKTYCQEGVQCCLLLDPTFLSPVWMKSYLPPVKQIYILAPLSAVKQPQCCQIRSVIEVVKDSHGELPRCTIVCRKEEHIPLCSGVECRRKKGGCLALVRMT